MFEDARNSGLLDSEAWWETINNFALDSEFRARLERLSHSNGKQFRFLIEDGVAPVCVNLLPFFQNIVVKCGDKGAFVASRISAQDTANSGWHSEKRPKSQHQLVAPGRDGLSHIALSVYPIDALADGQLVNVTGAGDTLVGTIAAGLTKDSNLFLDPGRLQHVMDLAQKASALTLQSKDAVSPDISQLVLPESR